MPANLVAADATTLRPQPSHWPLVFLLVLMPFAVGTSTLLALGELAHASGNAFTLGLGPLPWIGWIAGALGLSCSVLHLGQPTRAWRVFLGLRRSWLSREALLFGVWFPLATACLVASGGWIPVPRSVLSGLSLAAACSGLAAVFCSVMIYVDTRRQFWRLGQTAARFYGTGFVLTLSAALPFLAPAAAAIAAVLLAVVTGLKLATEGTVLAVRDEDPVWSAATSTARLLIGPLRFINELRITLALAGAGIIPALLLAGSAGQRLLLVGTLLVFGGEIFERLLFFRAVDAPKMPGVAP